MLLWWDVVVWRRVLFPYFQRVDSFVIYIFITTTTTMRETILFSIHSTRSTWNICKRRRPEKRNGVSFVAYWEPKNQNIFSSSCVFRGEHKHTTGFFSFFFFLDDCVVVVVVIVFLGENGSRIWNYMERKRTWTLAYISPPPPLCYSLFLFFRLYRETQQERIILFDTNTQRDFFEICAGFFSPGAHRRR